MRALADITYTDVPVNRTDNNGPYKVKLVFRSGIISHLTLLSQEDSGAPMV